MSEMVERVARAINEVANKQFNAYFVDREVSFALARAAIEAMREPTGAMIVAMLRCRANTGLPGLRPHNEWQAMIDEALRCVQFIAIFAICATALLGVALGQNVSRDPKAIPGDFVQLSGPLPPSIGVVSCAMMTGSYTVQFWPPEADGRCVKPDAALR